MAANYHHTDIGSLAPAERSQPGSYCELLFAPMSEYTGGSNLFTPRPGVATIPIAFFNKLYKAAIPPVQRGYTETTVQTDAGFIVEHRAKFFLPFDNLANQIMTGNMHCYRFFVIVITPGGVMRLLGDYINGARFNTRTFESGESYQDIPGIAGEFYWLNETPAPVLQGYSAFLGVL